MQKKSFKPLFCENIKIYGNKIFHLKNQNVSIMLTNAFSETFFSKGTFGFQKWTFLKMSKT